jgi:iron complex outermembrane receptor protein
MSTHTWAQEAAQGEDANSGQIDMIVVTARKTSENLQTTPVAVTAVSDIALDRAQINNVNQLQNIAPGLVVFPAVAQPGSAQFSLRGQGQNDGLIAVDQSVGAYVDGVYVARSSGALFNFVDIERVEVLRGPQGTLFGRNTTGGSVNVITKAPTNEFEGMVRGRYGNYNAFEATGVVNIPIAGSNGGLRLVAQHTQHEGYGRNVQFNRDLGGDNTEFVRGTFKVANADDTFSVTVQGDYTDRKTGGEMVGLKRFTPTGTNGFLVGVCNGSPVGPASALRPLCPVQTAAGDSLANYAVDVIGKDNFYDFYNSMPGIYGNAQTGGASATLNWDLNDDVAVKSISAWRKINTDSLSDNDGTPYVFTGGLASIDGNFIDQTQFSQELQLSGKAFENKLSYIFGAFFFREKGLDRSKSYAVFPLSPALSYVDADVINKSYAVYGQATYNLTDTVRFTGGLRYTWDKRSIVRRNRAETPGNSGNFTCSMVANTLDATGFTVTNGSVCQVTSNADYSYLSYTAGLDWQATSDLFFYAKTSRAYRAGGFNTRAVTGGSSVSFDPERVTDYEVGAKVDFLDRRARFNVAAFYTDYSNVQRNVPVVVPGSTTLTSGVQNAAAATIKGLEAELTVKPVNGLTLGASVTLLDPKFDSFTLPVTTRSGGTAIADASNTPYTLTPKTSFLLSADYEVPASFGSVNFHVDYAYRGKYFSQGPLAYPGVAGANGYDPSFGFVNPGTSVIPAYGILNGQIAVKLNDPNVEVAVYGRNILQKKYFMRLLALEDTALGFTSYLPGDPRTYGVTVTFRY